MWTLVLSSLGGTALGELVNASERQVKLPLNRLPTCDFKVRQDHPRAGELLGQDVLLKAYRKNTAGTKVLIFCGPLTTAEEVATAEGEPMLGITSAGAFWRLQDRLTGKGPQGYSQGSASSMVDRSLIAQTLVERANAVAGSNFDAGGDTGIRIGTITASAQGYVGPWYFKPVAEAISEMAATLDGFDFEVVPFEPTADASGVKIGVLNVGPFIGTDRTDDAIFEYGFGKKNVKGYRDQRSSEGLATRVYSLPSGYPDNPGAVREESDDEAELIRGRHEAVVSSDLVSEEMRRQLAQEHVRIRKQPRQVVTFEPHINAPEYGLDYQVGDLVTARAKVLVDGVLQPRFDAAFRVYGADFTLDDVGRESVALTLTPEG